MTQKLNLPPHWHHTHLAETDSTMRRVAELPANLCGDGEFHLFTADYQTLGHGQRGTTWEADRGKNLLFSFAFRPEGVEADHQFFVSEALALSVVRVLDSYTADISIKWPNDIYWREQKICGMLLEHVIEGKQIKRTLTGVGVNLNQRQFRSGAPNPVSLFQIIGCEVEPSDVMEEVACAFMQQNILLRHGLYDDLHEAYMARLYRRMGFHPYADAQGREFMAETAGISPLGILTLRTADGELRDFAFKEITFLSESLQSETEEK